MSPSADHEGYRIGRVDASTTVVVVGAGPSGLMLACNLVRFGIAVVILDDRPDKTSTGKADGMQPKTIETFRQLGLADSLLKNGARVYDISFWESTANESLKRTSRKTHYPEHVGASDPYILLAHQGMVEEVMVDDMEARGVSVTRNSKFVSCSRVDGTTQLDIMYEDVTTNTSHKIRADYLIGCDGARSNVRSFIPGAELEGELTNAAWGVLDGVVDTNFPDLWSKVAVRSHSAGSILWIPREKGMTRVYVELSSTNGERVEKSKASTEYVMDRAREAMLPFSLEWKTVEWFGTYVVGQRVAKRFMDPKAKIFIAGDAGHCHSALAAQGANTSMHDSFNLAWKLNLLVRGLAKPTILHTYEEERKKIANDLINFDVDHCKAFAAGDAALAKNFEDNIRFISGVGAEYAPGMLTQAPAATTHLQPGILQLPAKVTRYIDSNPVDIQLDIPLLGQFKIYFFVPDICCSRESLDNICQQLRSVLAGVSGRAAHSYQKQPRGLSPSDGFIQIQRYTTLSNAFTFAMVTQSAQSDFEIADLPEILHASRWTLYVDNIGRPNCTEKWFRDLNERIGISVVRPDGYVGAIDTWKADQVGLIGQWLQDYFSFMV
ncbi:3-hydroxybenzoate 4-monooxygenase [Penicillium chrysogenum]|uniref:Pc21g12890 protein n=2 Tax=Penicillium chrysogenum species complex TaxID=254878 RepID=B6HM29_PENRW|nr:uncharacterized protein N7525_007855 [Penicillium rubens]KAJ5829602.1 hypothetical protein N7525_007855 [Penicillium rubens]KAJ5852944.1 hypothetical protein N7534_005487 [Penicillium rubens]KZN88948.1 3-hydroxybenzoate 4-monooxygenase [Penicillium chrysogenum]CAP96186.1 Pc21g12890 [Penicillium rubens Wisconsin 54-1255]